MSPVVVVGAGLSGVACARELAAAGVAVRLVDRGRRAGGRMASRRLDGRPVDLGASYLTVSEGDPTGFGAVVADWERRGLAAPWTDTFVSLETGREPQTKQGPVRWGAPGGLRSLVEDLATGLDVELETHLETLPAVADAPVVVLAMPDPQAVRLLPDDDPDLAAVRRRLDRAFEPVLALAARWPARAWDLDGAFDGAFVNGHDVLAWVADDGRRRGDGAPVLVAHSTPDFARPHLAEPQAAAPAMTGALRDLLGLEPPVETYLHRWSVARPTGDRAEPFLLEQAGDRLVGACGDGWGATPKVETAWASGHALGRALVARLR
ncbi:NAD(P)/FAD-dependent oxidoreductase [Nocardioides plantarum]|uniref:NAD(P)/FAD-dependent oxidoreductase n=1 Tax=Nocardioides plantarum TaxID=29299 RepID=A0ABV5KCX7_9ACTN|nr:NAD(P)-binding protein [Nocardioides plantarum]